jgi:c(7)-type cytochrome triheme protein
MNRPQITVARFTPPTPVLNTHPLRSPVLTLYIAEMRYLIFLLAIAILPIAAQEKKAPDNLTFQAKMGNVTYNHAAHAKRLKDDCTACHDKLFPQSATAPLNYKAAMHKTAEAKQLSCGSCHRPQGTAFESKGNCNKCHVKAGAKS